MLKILRSCSYKIITRAVQAENRPLVATLRPNANDCDICHDRDQLRARLDTNPASIIVYNQHADAIALVDSFEVSAAQIFIEIRQDTKGVLGLHAIRQRNQSPETLELIYQ
jgi:hypothetical protein